MAGERDGFSTDRDGLFRLPEEIMHPAQIGASGNAYVPPKSVT